MFESLEEDGSCDGVKPGIERVKQNQAVRGKKLSEELGEGTAVSILRGITRAQGFEQFESARPCEAILNFLEQSFDLEAKWNTASGARFFGRWRQDKLVQLAFIEPGGMADFVNVVIFRGHPEDGNGFDAGNR